ncbi:MAG: hypothetical protein BM563_09635 [Bacteroidetes bacterium MedPE-SWsnd-G1]|nr:MAG: hypothetical protein BM563_09635 [Bacteroidetes bacterium MedPE-SWsnd-G1]
MKNFLLVILLLNTILSQSQSTKKTINSKRVQKAPKIDGVLDDDAWQGAELAKDFVMFRPETGTPETFKNRTEVRVVYDDEAIYFAAYLYDEDPENIPSQFASRDNFGTTDWFGIMINPNNDQINDTEFFIQVTGNQADAKSNPQDEDFSWSAVWQSSVSVVDDGWIVEVKIPYSALRFSNKEVQTWGLNFHRRFAKNRDQYTWNLIDRSVGNIQQYSGELTGIKNINPPTRLSFSPYASARYDSYDGEDSFDKSIGLDLKYGISESFTLDATLIPDFGQTGFDDLVLNLGPFEQQYQEQRPFFTEGVELFTKGDLFYTRRIGSIPTNYIDESSLEPNEELIENPDKVNMLNAIKVSGRTESGLGIGFFNAITEKTEAKIKDNDTGEVRNEITEPIANYNVLVLDQQFNKNSYISLINTSVIRDGSVRDANATALMWDLNDKKNIYNINGGFKVSNVRENGQNSDGYWFDTSIGDEAGNWQYQIGYEFADENYDINDLGFQYFNDYQNVYWNASYRIFEPTETFNRYSFFHFGQIRYRHSDGAYTGNFYGLNFNATTIDNFSFGSNINGNIGNQYDYYEPRVEDRYFTEAARLNFNGRIRTDSSKKFAAQVFGFYGLRFNDPNRTFEIGSELRYRFSDKFSLEYELEIFKTINDRGYVTQLDDSNVIFGNRDRKSLTNEISARHNFNTKSALALSFRHYWSPVTYDDQFYLLNEDGTLSEHPYSEDHDINYNVWNLDLSYSWEFAPGSQFIALYRNNIFNADNQSTLDFNDNLENLFDQALGHNISVKFIYYIDYNNAKNWFKKKAS